MDHFFEKFGSSSNVSSAEIYHGQKAGHVTGGGISIRNRVMDSRPLTVNLPRIDAGCGGIDIYAGGFSFISKDELIQNLKNIGTASLGYAFLLGLETVSPQIANTVKQLQTWANGINSTSINSCEIASQLVGSVWPRRTMANQQICRTMGQQQGKLADYVSARHGCAQASQYDLVREDQGEFKEVLKEENNIAWEAIKKQKYLSSDQATAELVMSLMGTVVVRHDDGKIHVQVYPSKISDESFLKVMLDGGTTNIYRCDNDTSGKCLQIRHVPFNLDPSHAWSGRIYRLLSQIQQRVLNDQELTEDEKGILSKTRFPLYKIINILTAYRSGSCPIDLYQVADMVAMDLLIQYLRECCELVRQGARQLKEAQMYSDAIDDYMDGLAHVEKTIRYYENRAEKQFKSEWVMIQKINLLEAQIASEIRL